jgi:hypothetical protein
LGSFARWKTTTLRSVAKVRLVRRTNKAALVMPKMPHNR